MVDWIKDIDSRHKIMEISKKKQLRNIIEYYCASMFTFLFFSSHAYLIEKNYLHYLDRLVVHRCRVRKKFIR
jgi:hypothetical protein